MKTPSLITAIVALAVLPGCASITGQIPCPWQESSGLKVRGHQR